MSNHQPEKHNARSTEVWHTWKYGDLTTGTMSGEGWRRWHVLLLEIWNIKKQPFYTGFHGHIVNLSPVCFFKTAKMTSCMAVCSELDLLSSKHKSMQWFAHMLLGKCSVKPHPLQLIFIFAVAKTASPVAFPQDWQRHEFLEVAGVGRPMVTSVCI